jgi:hypothetical protein
MYAARQAGPMHPRRRSVLAAAALVTVLAGVGARTALAGTVADVAGSVLYAVLVWLLVAVLVPRARTLLVTVAAWAACAGVELAQLTGVPARAVEVWDPARWVLGTTFHAPDLIAYAVGAVLVGGLDGVLRRRGTPGAAQRERVLDPTNDDTPDAPAASRSTS